MKQAEYHLACQKYTQAGDKEKVCVSVDDNNKNCGRQMLSVNYSTFDQLFSIK